MSARFPAPRIPKWRWVLAWRFLTRLPPVSWRSFERETRLYLDAEHVADLVRRGSWDEAERYIRAFAGGAFEDPCSDRIFLALRRRKDIEALER